MRLYGIVSVGKINEKVLDHLSEKRIYNIYFSLYTEVWKLEEFHCFQYSLALII